MGKPWDPVDVIYIPGVDHPTKIEVLLLLGPNERIRYSFEEYP